MATAEYRAGDEYRYMEQALWTLTALRATPADQPLSENQWLAEMSSGWVTSNDPLELILTLSQVIQGFAYLSSKLVDELAEASGESAEAVIATCRRFTETCISGFDEE